MNEFKDYKLQKTIGKQYLNKNPSIHKKYMLDDEKQQKRKKSKKIRDIKDPS